VYRVDKPVYGLSQAGRRWQRTLFPWLESWSAGPGKPTLQRSKADTCVFHLTDTVLTPQGPREETLLVGVYVDDLCVCASHRDKHSLYARFIADLQGRWAVEDEGACEDLLGIEIRQTESTTTLTQVAYIEKLFARFCGGIASADLQPLSTPSTGDLPQLVADALSSRDEPSADCIRAYQSIVGALLYAAVNTRPDIAYTVGMLGRAMARPSPALHAAAERVVQYLHRHRAIGLRYSRSTAELYGMSDADWATRHSTSGHVYMYCRAAISWASRKQKSVALSSCEAEIVAASDAAKEAAYLTAFLDELGRSSEQPLKLHVDNQAARNLAYNPEHHERTKHIDRRHFYVRELVEDGRIVVPFVRSADNIADFFTKPLPSKTFFKFRDIIMGYAD
jgi:hypothetical protein